MKKPTRRSFLKGTATLVPAVGTLAAKAPAVLQVGAIPGSDTGPTLLALARLVLPVTALAKAQGPGTVGEIVQAFEDWTDGFEPLAELDHPYLSSDELRYGPPDPRAEWQQQLLDLEQAAHKRLGLGFVDIEPAQQKEILEDHLPKEIASQLPHAGEAKHVAVALLSWFYATSLANDLCYQRKIERYECRGLPSVGDLPAALDQHDALDHSTPGDG